MKNEVKRMKAEIRAFKNTELNLKSVISIKEGLNKIEAFKKSGFKIVAEAEAVCILPTGYIPSIKQIPVLIYKGQAKAGKIQVRNLYTNSETSKKGYTKYSKLTFTIYKDCEEIKLVLDATAWLEFTKKERKTIIKALINSIGESKGIKAEEFSEVIEIFIASDYYIRRRINYEGAVPLK